MNRLVTMGDSKPKGGSQLMSLVLNEFGDFPMMRKMLRTIKQRAEADHR